MTARVNRPHKKSGPKRLYVRDTLSRTKRGANAIKAVTKIRVKALRNMRKVPTKTLREIEDYNAKRPLTDMQRMFVRYWAGGETPRTAAIMAGYSETSSAIGWKMSRDPAILAMYREEKKLYEEQAAVTRKEVIDKLREAYDHAKMVDEPSAMVAAAREMGKMCGFYEPEVKITVNLHGDKLVEKLSSLTDEQLIEIAEKGGELIDGEFARVAENPVPQLAPPRADRKAA